MIKKITDVLSKKGLSGWQLRWSHKKSFQSFLALDQLECRRQVETETCLISIYKKKPSGKMGQSSFKIAPANLPVLEQELDQALFAADLVNNDPFELPNQPSTLSSVQIKDPHLTEETLSHLENRIREAVEKEKGVRLSAAEFFVDTTQSRLLNHNGLDLTQEESLLHTEFILLAKSDRRENEYINRYSRRFLQDFDLEGELAQSALFAREATAAKPPKTGKFPVLLSHEPLDQLFNPLIARASARLKYNKMLDNRLGESVVAPGIPQGDRLTLWSNGTIDRAVGSSRFDSYGTPLGRVCLIENNVLKTYLADKRYGDYLGVTVTGELGNIEVQAGTRPLQTLIDSAKSNGKPLYHLLAFSAFEPNAITGAFSAEIRAGYEITPTGTRPIKGGSVSGVLQKDLLNCALSQERIQRERVLVPQGVLFGNLTIAGD
ncbi:MAG: hypothetical protein KCHDKBKB_02610 [Elusimicrobia bacterium]|nr:hypothetical protein [Elusimicrobiota bacterium]